MYEQLLDFSPSSNAMGIIWSIQGGHYVALQMSPQGEVLLHAEKPFRSYTDAQSWLKQHGINTISLRQTPAYFEMIGLPH